MEDWRNWRATLKKIKSNMDCWRLPIQLIIFQSPDLFSLYGLEKVSKFSSRGFLFLIISFWFVQFSQQFFQSEYYTPWKGERFYWTSPCYNWCNHFRWFTRKFDFPKGKIKKNCFSNWKLPFFFLYNARSLMHQEVVSVFWMKIIKEKPNPPTSNNNQNSNQDNCNFWIKRIWKMQLKLWEKLKMVGFWLHIK